MKNLRIAFLSFAFIFLTSPMARAQALEDILAEKGVITKSEAASAAAGEPGALHYSNGIGWDFPDSGTTGHLTTILRTVYAFTSYDHKNGDTRTNTSSFDVTRARLIASGSVLDKKFSYYFLGDFAEQNKTLDNVSFGQKSTPKVPTLRDAYITYHANDWADLGMGQHKTGISREYVASSPVFLQFTDEAMASQYFNLGRQAGIWFSGSAADLPITFGAGVYNGESDHEGENVSGLDTDHTGVLNVRWNPLAKIDPALESDINESEDLGLSLGAATAFSRAQNDLIHAGSTAGNDVFTLNLDGMAKYRGWSFAGEYYYRNLSSDQLSTDVHPSGMYVQSGYMIIPGEFELAARYGFLNCDKGQAPGFCSGNSNINNADVTANYYFSGNNLKTQLDWSLLRANPVGSGNDRNTHRIVLALTGVF